MLQSSQYNLGVDKMSQKKTIAPGILISVLLAIFALYISKLMPKGYIGASVIAMLVGIFLNPLLSKYSLFNSGLSFTSKKILKLGIILMGASLSFTQVLQVGKFSLIVMCFTLVSAFGGGYLLGRLFDMDWRLSSLISAGTGICGGSAVAAIAPVIDSEDSQIAYAISATFIFDIFMVILFPLMGVYFGMNDLGYGLWAGTAVNDTSSVVAAGYAFSDIAGNYAVIVKLTRTLSIVPIVLIFSAINRTVKKKQGIIDKNEKINFSEIFPFFIIMFLAMVGIKSIGIIPEALSLNLSELSKFLMVMSLGAIGLKTNFSSLAKSGFKPMLHGFLISTLVVVVSFAVQSFLGQV